jgi:rsbT co-antagonist protein RsbR
MSIEAIGHLANILTDNKDKLLQGWLGSMSSLTIRDKKSEAEIREQAGRFVTELADATAKDKSYNIDAPGWADLRHLLSEISEMRVRQGFTPIETANFIFSLKEPVFALLREKLTNDLAVLVDETAAIGALFDRLGLYTIAEYQKTREKVIMRQQQELLELSTPVVQLWRDVLALPLIGTLDSARTQVVMESLLQKIVDTGASIAIIDITGVPTVDTLVAQHLLKTVAAARLMGADCIISGIRPQIAQTIVHLGVNLEDVITKASLADAFLVALKRLGASVTYANQN